LKAGQGHCGEYGSLGCPGSSGPFWNECPVGNWVAGMMRNMDRNTSARHKGARIKSLHSVVPASPEPDSI